MPVRVGMPFNVTGLSEVIRNPIYATSVGLLLYSKEQQLDGVQVQEPQSNKPGVWHRVKEWVKGEF